MSLFETKHNAVQFMRDYIVTQFLALQTQDKLDKKNVTQVFKDIFKAYGVKDHLTLHNIFKALQDNPNHVHFMAQWFETQRGLARDIKKRD